jgi:hypothetical protein
MFYVTSRNDNRPKEMFLCQYWRLLGSQESNSNVLSSESWRRLSKNLLRWHATFWCPSRCLRGSPISSGGLHGATGPSWFNVSTQHHHRFSWPLTCACLLWGGPKSESPSCKPYSDSTWICPVYSLSLKPSPCLAHSKNSTNVCWTNRQRNKLMRALCQFYVGP